MAFSINWAEVPQDQLEFWRGVDERARSFVDSRYKLGSIGWRESYDASIVFALMGKMLGDEPDPKKRVEMADGFLTPLGENTVPAV